jgi:hypothetical protein
MDEKVLEHNNIIKAQYFKNTNLSFDQKIIKKIIEK